MASVVFTDLDTQSHAKLLALKQVFVNATLSGNAPRRSVVKSARAISSGKPEICLRF